MSYLEKYRLALCQLPASGGGGCHTALLSVSNLGRMAKLPSSKVFSDLRLTIRGTRYVPDREIQEAVNKAFSQPIALAPYTTRSVKVTKREDLISRIAEEVGDVSDAELFELSPVKIDWEPEQDPIYLLNHLYQENEFLFIGDKMDKGERGKNILTAGEWKEKLKIPAFPHIIPNPLTGEAGITQDGKNSLRADACVKDYKFAVIEFDDLNRNMQIAISLFFIRRGINIAAIIDSGGKSLHLWVEIRGENIQTKSEWDALVKNELFHLAGALGADAATSNPARLSRLPGFLREKRFQRLLYLRPLHA